MWSIIPDMDDKVKTHLKKYKPEYIILVLAIVALLIGFIGYKKGYRFTENFMIGKAGKLSLNVALPLANIFIDEGEKIVTTKDNELLEISLSPRKHTVIISREGYFPWKKDFVMQSEGKVDLSPVFVSSNPSGMVITNKDPEFWKIRNKIIVDPVPTKESPRISKDGKAKLWLDDNAVMVEIASTTKTVIQPDPAIRNLYFYKDRTDVIIFSINNAIYAIEVEKDGTQNFLPIYKGASPSFIEGALDYIYVLDGEILMQVYI